MQFCIPRSLRILPVLLLTSAAGGQTGTEFMTVERVDQLRVLNRYQQEASAAERRFLVPFAPLRVISKSVLLSDGYTPAMEVEAGGEQLFLLRDQHGDLAPNGSAGVVQTFPRAVPLTDSVVILAGGMLSFSPVTSSPALLPAGRHLLRFFHQEGKTYCRTEGPSPAFGWVVLPRDGEGRSWKRLPAGPATAPRGTSDIPRRIRERLADVNRALRSFFECLTAETGQVKNIPRWEVQEDAGGLVCTLTGTTRPELFRESSEYLVRDVENILLGSGAQVISGPGTIDIRFP
jgi:hypothetical protein